MHHSRTDVKTLLSHLPTPVPQFSLGKPRALLHLSLSSEFPRTLTSLVRLPLLFARNVLHRRIFGSSMTPVAPIMVRFNSGISSNRGPSLESIGSWNLLLSPAPTMNLLVIQKSTSITTPIAPTLESTTTTTTTGSSSHYPYRQTED